MCGVCLRRRAGQVPQDEVVSDELARARDQLAAEQRFIDERGGSQWIDTYIKLRFPPDRRGIDNED